MNKLLVKHNNKNSDLRTLKLMLLLPRSHLGPP